MFGTIRLYKEDKGWGFLISKKQKQIFFHISEWVGQGNEDSDSIPAIGDRVEYELGPSTRNGYPSEAKNVRKIITPFERPVINPVPDSTNTTQITGADLLAGSDLEAN